MENWIIRNRKKRDNAAVAQLIRAVFDELIKSGILLMQILIWT
jgi:hypothetical protein